MGNALALSPAFKIFASYPLSRSRRIIGIFHESGMDFAATEGDVALLLDGDTTTAKKVVYAFRSKTSVPQINILSFISAMILFAKEKNIEEPKYECENASTKTNDWSNDQDIVAEKIEHLLELFDFKGSENLKEGDLTIMIMCVLHGYYALLNHEGQTAMTLKAMEAQSSKMAAHVFRSLSRDICWSLPRADVARYFLRRFQRNRDESSFVDLMSLLQAPSQGGTLNLNTGEVEMSPSPPNRPRPSKFMLPEKVPPTRRKKHQLEKQTQYNRVQYPEMSVNPFYRQDLAVTTIQCEVRASVARARVRIMKLEHRSAAIIQNMERQRVAAFQARNKQHTSKFAIRIQSLIRMRQSSFAASLQRSRYKAATVLQKYQRRRMARKAVFQKREIMAVEYSNTACGLLKDERFDEAAYNYRNALRQQEKSHGVEHPATAVALSNLAGIYDRQGRYEEAVALYERALAIKEAAHGLGHANTATTLDNLALALYNLHDFAKSQQFFSRSLRIKEEAHSCDIDIAITLNNMASCAEKCGNLEDAATAYSRALSIREVELGLEDPCTVATINGLASVNLHQGNFEVAENLYRRLLALKEKIHGKDSPTTARTMNNLALALFNQGDLFGAAGLYERCIDIKIRTHANQQDIASSLHNLAGVKNDLKEHKAAYQLYSQALEIRERLFGDNIDTASTCAHLALVLNSLGRATEALSYMQRALVVKEKILGPLSTSTQNSQSWCNYLEGISLAEKR